MLIPAYSAADTKYEKATFTARCLQCTESPLEKIDGVIEVSVGFAVGNKENCACNQVTSDTAGYAESAQATFDPSMVRHEKLLDIFSWEIAPAESDGQFVYRGTKYPSMVVYHSEEHARVADKSMERLCQSAGSGNPMLTKPVRSCLL